MNDGDRRPDPDHLLRQVQADEARATRGRLKIFFGYAPGVGKTFAMLQAAAREREQGVDVVLGCIETHGRAQTEAQLAALPEPLPRRASDHRGTLLEEFDLDAAIARAPALLLVDELAHDNVPGSRHKKRWQDVFELLDHGIDVWTTLNVQHVESLNDAVAQVTHIVVKETVPDAVLDRADEIELVDLPPDDLLERLKAGLIYMPATAERAAGSFFRRGNLLALREFALRRTTERVDADVRAWRDANGQGRTQLAARRILAFVHTDPSSPRVIRTARRLADEADVPWIVAVVDSSLRPLTTLERGRREAWLVLAERLGATVLRLSGVDLTSTLLAAARRDNVTQLVLARPPRSPRATLERWLGRDPLSSLLLGAGELELHVISAAHTADEDARDDIAVDVAAPLSWSAAAGAVTLVAAATAVGGVLQFFGAVDVVMLYLAVIMVVAVRFGSGASVLASALSVAAFDFFFVVPHFTFNVADLRHVITFAMMFIVGVFISGITARLRRQQDDARHREQRTRSLLAMTRATASEVSREGIAWALAHQCADTVLRPTAVVLKQPDGSLKTEAAVGVVVVEGTALAAAEWVALHGRPAGRGTDTLPGAPALVLPLQGSSTQAGVLLIYDRVGGSVLDREHQELLDAFGRQAALVLERVALADEAKSSAIARRSDEVRASLLSAVSHDLRTPLAGITGAATTLRDQGDKLSAVDRHDLLDDIASEAFHLERLVESLLDMTRVDSGALVLHRAAIPVDEAVGSAVARVEARLSTHPLTVKLPEELVFVDVDSILFERILVNLLENAIRHTPTGSAIDVSVVADGDVVEFVVADRGPGFPAGVDVFEKFSRGESSTGIGLGLAISRGLVAAHGGTITVRHRDGGGAEVVVRVGRAAVPAGGPV